MATKETKRPFSIHRTEQVFTWKWQRLEARKYAMKSLTEMAQYHNFRVSLTVVNETIILTLNKLLAPIL